MKKYDNLTLEIMNMLSYFDIEVGDMPTEEELAKDKKSFKKYCDRYNKALEKYAKAILKLMKGKK